MDDIRTTDDPENEGTVDFLDAKTQKGLVREQWVTFERSTRIKTLFAAAQDQGIVGMFGDITKKQQTVNSTFEPSEIPGLCRTCRNAISFQQEWRQPTVICNATGQLMPTTITKCSMYRDSTIKAEKLMSWEEMERKALVVGPAEGAWKRKRDASEGKQSTPNDEELKEWRESRRRGYK